MNPEIRASLDHLRSGDRGRQDAAFSHLAAATAAPVDWAYDAWDELVELLGTGDNRQRAIAAQVLCNLAGSDPEERMLEDFDALLAVTRDERFVTARHCMQSLHRVGAAGEKQRRMLVAGLERRFGECAAEKNRTLIRYDIVQALRKVYDATPDESVRDKALELIGSEEDPKYRRKYAALWRK